MNDTKKIVVLTEKFCDLNPSLGATSALSNILGSLASAGISEVAVHHYDEYLYQIGHAIDDFLLESVRNTKPNYVFCSYYPFNDPRNVKLDTFQAIRMMGIPVIFIWFDFGHAQIRDLANRVGSQVGNLNVVVDTFDQTANFMPMWVPQDERLFRPSDKEIDVSFVGTKNGYGTRQRYLNFLSGRFPVYISGGQREHRLTIEGYAGVLGKSKITINFPDKPDGIIQAKCRIYEAMLSGAMLLEQSNEAIKKWFEPMVHYVPFDGEQDLLDKINYYLHHPDERDKIVANATLKMKTDYSSANWWNTVLEKAI